MAQYWLNVAAVVVLLRRRVGRPTLAAGLDALIGALAVGAVVGVVVGSAPSAPGPALQRLVQDLFPVAGVVLLVLTSAAFPIGAARPARTWWLLLGAFVAQVVSDYASMVGVALGLPERAWMDLGWPVAVVLLARAALDAADAGPAPRPQVRLAPGLFFGAVSLAVVVADRVLGLAWPVLGLAVAGLGVISVRLALAMRENAALLAGAVGEARTDALTGLGNRRALLTDLEAVRPEAPAVLALFDLDGFKRFNDVLGHPAGDALLMQIGGRLRAALAELPGGRAYRLGGDELCLLVPGGEAAVAHVAATGVAALSLTVDGLAVSASVGCCVAPAEGGPAAVLGAADRAMYRDKAAGRRGGSRGASGVLAAVLAERDPALRAHADEVAGLAVGTARLLGMDPVAVDETREAAVLHDVGKLAVPDAVLGKAGPLDALEWTAMRRHTLTGERIIGAAGDLDAVAAIVRASHERWDGGGYPDGLAGEAIPLAARVVAVCDAYDAMVAERPYRPARTPAAAVGELRRCAGAQFDPAVVRAFERVVAGARVPA